MHFCVSATRGGFQDGFCCSRKMGTNWFMPALVKSRLGASGSNDEEGTMVCCFSRKKSKNDFLISELVIADLPVAHGKITAGHHFVNISFGSERLAERRRLVNECPFFVVIKPPDEKNDVTARM